MYLSLVIEVPDLPLTSLSRPPPPHSPAIDPEAQTEKREKRGIATTDPHHRAPESRGSAALVEEHRRRLLSPASPTRSSATPPTPICGGSLWLSSSWRGWIQPTVVAAAVASNYGAKSTVHVFFENHWHSLPLLSSTFSRLYQISVYHMK